jgi:hypothetical protein
LVSMALGHAFGGGVNPRDIQNEENVRLHVLPPCLDIIRLDFFLAATALNFSHTSVRTVSVRS